MDCSSPHDALHALELSTDRVEALDWFLRNHRAYVAKAIDPLTKPGITTIAARLSRAIRGKTGKGEAAAIKNALRTLDVDWVRLEEEARERVLMTAKRTLASNLQKKALPKVKRQFELAAFRIHGNSKKRSIAKHKLDIGFSMTKLDKDMARFVARSNVNFVSDEYGRRAEKLSQHVRKVVASGVKRGATSREMVKQIRQEVTGLSSLGRGDFYWEVVSLSFANRARNYGTLSSFGEAGIERFIWDSVLDEVTTETCRFFHGKKFTVAGAIDTFKRAEKAKDPEDLKQIQPWISQGVDDDGKPILFSRNADGGKNVIAEIISPGIGESDRVGQYSPKMTDSALLGNGFSMPPIHGLCRSTVVPDI